MITVNVSGDMTVEPDEGFTVTLSDATGNATITTATALGVIRNDDVLSIPRADLSLVQTVTNSHPNVGDQVTFTLSISNSAVSDDATGVAVSDSLPAGLTLVNSLPSQGNYNGATGVWTVGALSAGQTATLSITAIVASAGAKTNTAEITAADQIDPDSTPGNGVGGEDDLATLVVTPQISDLSLVITVDNALTAVGQRVTFDLFLNNLGPNAATGVTVAAPLPGGLAFVSSAPDVGSYNPDTGAWDVGAVAANTTTSLQIVATVISNQVIRYTAQIASSDQFDPNSIPGNGIPVEDDQFNVDLGLCLTSGPLTVGMNQLTYSCVTPGGFVGFVMGTQLGSHHFNRYGVTVDIGAPSVPAIGVGNIDGVAIVQLELSAAQLSGPIFMQAFEMLPGKRVSNAISRSPGEFVVGTPLVAETVGFGAATLPIDSLPDVISAAIASWQTAGATAVQLQQLRLLDVQTSDLPGNQIASTSGNFILLDNNAAGNGWFVDPTATDNVEFTLNSSGVLNATATAAINRIDTLTVLMHEMAHVLGQIDVVGAASSELMLSELPVGTRRFPSPLPAPEFDPLDVNRDGRVSALDALVVINQMNRAAQSQLTITPSIQRSLVLEPAMLQYDANRDGKVSASDALKIINYLNRVGPAEVAGGEQSQNAVSNVDNALARLELLDEDLVEMLADDLVTTS